MVYFFNIFRLIVLTRQPPSLVICSVCTLRNSGAGHYSSPFFFGGGGIKGYIRIIGGVIWFMVFRGTKGKGDQSSLTEYKDGTIEK